MPSQERQCPPEFLNSQILLGKNIRAVRDSLGISRELAAEQAGIDTDYLGEIERGEKWPALWMIRAIARALKVSPTRFFEFEEESDAGTTAVERLQQIVQIRAPEDQERALRIVKVLFGL